MSSDFFLLYEAKEDTGIQSEPASLHPLQLHTKATTAILEASMIPAHGQSTSNVSDHGEITHLTGAHTSPGVNIIVLASEGKFHQEQSFSIDGDPLFGHKLSPNEPFLAFLSGYFQKIGNIRAQGLFCDLFSVFLHRQGIVTTRNYIPISGHHRLLTLTFFLIYS